MKHPNTTSHVKDLIYYLGHLETVPESLLGKVKV